MQLPTTAGRRRLQTAVPRLLAALGGLLVLACGGAATRTSQSSAPSDVQHVDLRLGYQANLTHATALVGVQRGTFAADLGSNVRLRTSTFNAGPDEVTALLSNSIDAAYLGPNPAINAFTQSHGQAIRIVSGATSGGASLVVKPAITSVAQLRGKTLATPQLGNTQDVALRYWLARNGLRTTPEGSGDVSIHPQDNAQTLQTFRQGQVDGAWVPEPWASRLVLEGGGRVLVDERDLWLPSRQFATTLLAVRTDYLRQHPTAVRRLLTGQVDASKFLNSQPAEAQKSADDAIGQITGKPLAAPVVAEAWTHMTFTNDPIASSLARSASHAEQLGLLPAVNLNGIFDLSLLNQVLSEKGLPQVRSS